MNQPIPGYMGMPFQPPAPMGGIGMGAPLGPPASPAVPGGAAGSAPQQNITPGMVEAMMKQHGAGARKGLIERQRKLADMMRNSASDQLRGTQVGRMYAAPGALQLLGSVAGSYAASKQDELADEEARRMGQDEAEQARQTMEALTGKPLPMPPPRNPYAPAAGASPSMASTAMDWFKQRFGGG